MSTFLDGLRPLIRSTMYGSERDPILKYSDYIDITGAAAAVERRVDPVEKRAYSSELNVIDKIAKQKELEAQQAKWESESADIQAIRQDLEGIKQTLQRQVRPEYTPPPKMVCSYCGKENHTEEKCFKKRDDTRASARPTCEHCGRVGHTHDTCWTNPNSSEYRPGWPGNRQQKDRSGNNNFNGNRRGGGYQRSRGGNFGGRGGGYGNQQSTPPGNGGVGGMNSAPAVQKQVNLVQKPNVDYNELMSRLSSDDCQLLAQLTDKAFNESKN